MGIIEDFIDSVLVWFKACAENGLSGVISELHHLLAVIFQALDFCLCWVFVSA